MRRDRELKIKTIYKQEIWGPSRDDYGKAIEQEHNASLDRAIRKAYTAGRQEERNKGKKHD